MADEFNSLEEEINISELLSAIWAHRFLIFLFTCLSIFLAGNYTLTAEKTFTARAIFQIEENDSPGFNIPGELGAIASLAGLSGGGGKSSSKSLIERVEGREFILLVTKKSSLDQDKYFNGYDPNHVDPLWKATIKKILGWEKTEAEKNAIIEKNIIKNYQKKVKFEETDGGAIEITVKHFDPNKAAEYANTFMEEIRKLVENESRAEQELRLSYLSETLADSLQEMDQAQKNLKEFALKNSAMAQENFISGSLKLDEIRMEKRKVEDISKLLSVLDKLVKTGNLDDSSYESLRASNPLVDDISFRRILGMSETISAWSWPEIETIEAVSATLNDRSKRLEVEINNIEENAKIYATSAEELAKFTRDAKIAEATYAVLIEQVKSQSLAAGFQPETFKVFEYATPPIEPSWPSKILVLALGAVFGVIIGCITALVNSVRRGVYYTRTALISDARAQLALKSKSIRKLSRRSITKIKPYISRQRVLALDEADIKLANQNIIYVLNSGGKINASDLAKLLAVQSGMSGRKVVLCDTTGQSEKAVVDKSKQGHKKTEILNLEDNLSLMTGSYGSSFFTSTDFKQKIKELSNQFDQVFICSSTSHSNLGLMALADFSPSFVLIAGLRSARKLDIKRIRKTQPVDLLFYD